MSESSLHDKFKIVSVGLAANAFAPSSLMPEYDKFKALPETFHIHNR